MEDNDLTVREALIQTLDQSPQEFELMKRDFKRASDAFDLAHDQDGLQIVRDDIVPRMQALIGFCLSIYEYHLNILGKEYAEDFCARTVQLNSLMEKISKETENGNFTEVGDILRFDFYDFINDMNMFFQKIRPVFAESSDPRLDMK